MLHVSYCVMSTTHHYEWKELAWFDSLEEAEQALTYFKDSGYPDACIEDDIEF